MSQQLLEYLQALRPQDIAKEIYYHAYRHWEQAIASSTDVMAVASNWTTGNYQVYRLNSTWAGAGHICVVDHKTGQPAIEFTYQPGQFVPKGKSGLSVYVDEKTHISQIKPQYLIELAKTFIDPLYQAVLLAKFELQQSGKESVSTPEGLIFEQQSDTIAVYSFGEATADGAMLPIAQLFADGSFRSVPVSEQTITTIRSLFTKTIDRAVAQACQREAGSCSTDLPPVSPDQKLPPLTTPSLNDLQGTPMATTQAEPEQKAPKSIEFDFFRGGGANVFAGQRTAYLAKAVGAEVQEAANGAPYMTMTRDQATKAIAVCNTKEWQVEKVSSAVWAPRAQDVQKAQVAIVADDMETVAQANLFLAQNAPDHKMLANAQVKQPEAGGVRIEKSVMVFGESKQGNCYVADKRLTMEGDKLVVADPETNKRAAIVFMKDTEGKVTVNRIAEANKVLDRPLDFAKAAENSEKAVAEVKEQMQQKTTEAAKAAEPAKAAKKTKAKAKAKADLEID